MLNELFAREILETSIALGILQEINGGVVIYHEASKEDPENLPCRVVYRRQELYRVFDCH